LLEASTHDIKLNVMAELGSVKVGISNVEVARQKDLDGTDLGVKTDLALQDHGSLEHLSGVGKAQVSLKADRVIQTALEDVCATEGMLDHRDASGLDVSLRKADSLVLVTELGDQTRKDIALKEPGIHMNVPSQFTTFIERAQSE
jgi:hypothetical protein